MIRSFGSKETEKVFNRGFSHRLPRGIQRTALKKLKMIHRATSLSDLLFPPGNRIELLKGNRQGQWSIRINDQWRICFHWQEDHAFNVEIIDYH